MLTDIKISQQNKMSPISEIAKNIGIKSDELELYGQYKAKISYEGLKRISQNKQKGKLILVKHSFIIIVNSFGICGF